MTYTRRKQAGSNAKSVEYTPTQLYRVDNGHLLAAAGLAKRVCSTLQDAGIRVRFEDYRKDPCGVPDYGALDNLREGQDEAIVQVVSNLCGVIKAPTGFGKSFLMRQLTKLWRHDRFIIASPFASITRGTYMELLKLWGPNEVGLVGDGSEEPEKRIVCCVDKSLRKCDLSGCAVFLYDEVHRAAAEKSAEAIARIVNARRYGLSASPTGRSDGADLETQAMFGPMICEFTYEEVQRSGSIVPIEVRVMQTDLCSPINYQEITAVERHGLWRNEERNNLIVKAVEQSRAEFGPDVQILISVETVDHGAHLARILPDFTLVYASIKKEALERYVAWGLLNEDAHPIDKKRIEEYRQSFRSGQLRCAIATGVWGTGVDFPHLQVLIRADAQASEILNTQIPGRVTRSTAGKEIGIVYDFDDRHHRILAGRADRRFAMYRRKGWDVIWIPAARHLQ